MDDLEIDNLPNRLTILRILLIPIVVMSLYFIKDPSWIGAGFENILGHIACWVFVLASITDFLDGYIARKKNIVTVFGSFLDPIADKFLVVSSLIMLMALDRVHEIIVIILVLREMYVTSLRLLAMHEEISIPVSSEGKWKTTFQMIGIPMLMLYQNWLGLPLILIGTIAIYISSFISVWSSFKYSFGLIVKLKHKRQMKKKQKLGLV